MSIFQSGITQKAFNDLLGRRPLEPDNTLAPLELSNLIGQFGILIIGQLISILVFVIECIIMKRGENQNNKNIENSSENIENNTN